MKSAIRNVLAPAALAAALVVGGCKSDSSSGSDSSKASVSAPVSSAKSAELHATLNSLLQDHAVLALNATDAALGGRNDEFTAAAGALDDNSKELAGAIGSVYGSDAETQFLALWRKHIGFFVDYTKATAAKDATAQAKSVNDLMGYTQDFGAFLESATGGRLPKAAVADLVKTHVVGLKNAVDAEAAKDYAKAFSEERAAEKHMTTIGNAIADAIVNQFPDKFQ
jgi:hypothetical protein